MSIRILNELNIDVGDCQEHTITLWWVAYSERVEANAAEHWALFVKKLQALCESQGWFLEYGDDPYREKSLGVFAGFSRPDAPRDLITGWEDEA